MTTQTHGAAPSWKTKLPRQGRQWRKRLGAAALCLGATTVSLAAPENDTPPADDAATSLSDHTSRLLEQSRAQGGELWRKSVDGAGDLWQRSRETATQWWQQSSDLWQETAEPPAPRQREHFAELWSDVLPPIEDTLSLQDAQRDLPERAWFARDQRDVEKDINALLDQAVAALSLSPLQDERAEIAGIRASTEKSREKIAEYRRDRVAAPTQSLVKRTREDYDQLIASEQQSIEDSQARLGQIQRDFGARLREIGLELTDEQVEFLLATVVGDTMIDLGIVFDNVKIITVELERLVRESGEDLASARRYYGLYVVLLRALKQMHLEVEQRIETEYIPQIDQIRQRAQALSTDTRELLRAQPERAPVLQANLDAQQMTSNAAGRYRDYLAEQARQVRRAREALEQDIRTAWNTYETVRVSGELVALVQSSQQLLDGLLERQVPPLRPFENLEMKREFEKLTDQLRASES
ncbi:hypothetical protein Thiowin_02961 [Thiorhodovibrio winogradskyi]|uniref:Secreted protein n=1 Tax=Thiorhodovibrio winogradskyi TaxID=77007 RepID=A0ABZ0SA61_9GAMM|nr:hypothetical protein [Thiorhodovibrio winogradskyi]